MENSVRAEIDRLKSEGHSVFSVSIAGKSYIYRSVNRKEFRELQDLIASKTDLSKEGETTDNKISMIKELSEEALVQVALIDPVIVDLEQVPAGVVTRISELILEASGFGEEVAPVQL